jgi:hypothetical protein
MAAVYRNQRKLGKIWPNGAGAIVAATIGGKRLGCFTSADLAIAAILDIAIRPIELDALLVWVEELLVEETAANGAETYAIDVDLKSDEKAEKCLVFMEKQRKPAGFLVVLRVARDGRNAALTANDVDRQWT